MARSEAALPDGIEAVTIVTPNHSHAAIAQRRHKRVDERGGDSGRRGRSKAWSPAAPGVGVQCELRDHQRRAAYIQRRTTESHLVVGEYPQVGDLLGHLRRVGRAVEDLSIVESDSIERVQCFQLHVIAEPAPAQSP